MLRKALLVLAVLTAGFLSAPAVAQDEELVINISWPPEDALVLAHVERRLGDGRLIGPDPGRAYRLRIDRVISDKTGLVGETVLLQSTCSDSTCAQESWTPEPGKSMLLKLRLDRQSRSFFRLRGW